MDDDALSFDDVLAIVLSQFVNRRVRAIALMPGNPRVPGLIAVTGTLYPSGDIAEARRLWAPMAEDEAELEEYVGAWASHHTQDPDTLAFHLREHSPFSGFWIDRPRFVSARWASGEPIPTLEIVLLGGVVLRLTDETVDDET